MASKADSEHKKQWYDVQFEVIVTITVTIMVLCYVTPCNLVQSPVFEITCCFQLQSRTKC
jgi:hypothetical protein